MIYSEGVTVTKRAEAPAVRPASDPRWAGLADLVLVIAREIQFRGYADARGVTVRPTERGESNYALVRQEWASAVAVAAGHDAGHLDAALALLGAVEAGLTSTRPGTPGRPAALM